MTKEKTCKSVRLYYGIFLGVFTVVVGALFIWQVLDIYLGGIAPEFDSAHVFSRERVLKALSKIDLFFWLWIAAVVVGFVLWEVFPVKEKPRKICPDLQYARLIKKLPTSAPEGKESAYEEVRQTERLIRGIKWADIALLSVAAVMTVVYLCIPSNFPGKDVTQEILNMVKVVFPVIFAALIVMCVGAYLQKVRVKNALDPLRNVVGGAKPAAESGNATVYQKVCAFFDDKRVILALRVGLAVIGVAFIIWGALNGNARAIFIKAINICTECIGLG